MLLLSRSIDKTGARLGLFGFRNLEKVQDCLQIELRPSTALALDVLKGRENQLIIVLQDSPGTVNFFGVFYLLLTLQLWQNSGKIKIFAAFVLVHAD